MPVNTGVYKASSAQKSTASSRAAPPGRQAHIFVVFPVQIPREVLHFYNRSTYTGILPYTNKYRTQIIVVSVEMLPILLLLLFVSVPAKSLSVDRKLWWYPIQRMPSITYFQTHNTTAAATTHGTSFQALPFPDIIPQGQGSHRDSAISSSLSRPHGGGGRTGRRPPARGLRGCGRCGTSPARLTSRGGTGVCVPHARRQIHSRTSAARPGTQC